MSGPSMPEQRERAEWQLLASLTHAPDRIPSVRRTISATSFSSLQCRHTFEAMCSAHELGRAAKPNELIPAVFDFLRQRVTPGMADAWTKQLGDCLGDPHLTNGTPEHFANVVHSLYLSAALRDAHHRLASDPDDALAEEELAKLVSERAVGAAGIPVLDYAFFGDRYDQLANSPAPAALIPGLVYPGHLSVLEGAPFAGKSGFAFHIASSAALGVAPWEGLEAPAPQRVLYLSFDESCDALYRRQRMADMMDPARRTCVEGWRDNLILLGRHASTPQTILDLVRLSPDGVAKLENVLASQAEIEQPISGIVIDTLATALAAGIDENKNSEMSDILGRLESLAVRHSTWILVIHHTGKLDADDPRSEDPTRAGRGASAIAGTARAVALLLNDPGAPNCRILRCRTNLAATPPDLLFEVSPQDQPNSILYWRPVAAASDDVLSLIRPGEKLTLNEFALRIAPGTELDSRGRLPRGVASRVMTVIGRLQRDRKIHFELQGRQRRIWLHDDVINELQQDAGDGDAGEPIF